MPSAAYPASDGLPSFQISFPSSLICACPKRSDPDVTRSVVSGDFQAPKGASCLALAAAAAIMLSEEADLWLLKDWRNTGTRSLLPKWSPGNETDFSISQVEENFLL
jgi:hypothetical protein